MAVTRAIFQFVKLVAGYSLSILHELILKYYFTTNKDKEQKCNRIIMPYCWICVIWASGVKTKK